MYALLPKPLYEVSSYIFHVLHLPYSTSPSFVLIFMYVYVNVLLVVL